MDKHNIPIIRKGNNSINAGPMAMVLAFCTFHYTPLSVFQASLIYLQHFYRYALDKLIIEKIRKGDNNVLACDRVMVFFTLHFLCI